MYSHVFHSALNPIRLITLDAPRCIHEGTDHDLPTQKRRFALLVYLAMVRSAPRARVAAMFNPEVEERRANHRLSQCLYAIRRLLGDDCIVTTGSELRASDALLIDARDFGMLADLGEFDAAVNLYHRPFLDGFYVDGAGEFESWVERRRAILARTHERACRTIINQLIEQCDFAGAAAHASHWLERDGHSQDAHRLFMIALVQAGYSHGALDHYASWERWLRETEGERPPDGLRKLAEEIRLGAQGVQASASVLPVNGTRAKIV
jgi:DNA-binding SARP family transcriptional activator